MADLVTRLDAVANSTLYSEHIRELTGEAATFIRIMISTQQGLQAALKEATLRVRELRKEWEKLEALDEEEALQYPQVGE